MKNITVTSRTATAAAAAAAGLTALLLLSAGSCDPAPQSDPVPCVEADGEACDDDPFDLDDLHKTKKPVVVAPVKPVTPYRPPTPKQRK